MKIYKYIRSSCETNHIVQTNADVHSAGIMKIVKNRALYKALLADPKRYVFNSVTLTGLKIVPVCLLQQFESLIQHVNSH